MASASLGQELLLQRRRTTRSYNCSPTLQVAIQLLPALVLVEWTGSLCDARHSPLAQHSSHAGSMQSPAQVSGSKRQSILSTSSNLSTTTRTSHCTSPSHSAAAWVPYASLRAVGTVHNKIIQRQRQLSLDSQQLQVAKLPSTPRRQHIYKPATPPLLPPLDAAEETQRDESTADTAAERSDRRQVREEEQKEALTTIDTQRSSGSSLSSRPTTAPKSTRSRTVSSTTAATTTTTTATATATSGKQQPPQLQQDSQSTTDQAAQPQPPPQPSTTPPLIDPLPAYLSVVQPSERLTRLSQKRAAAHKAVLDTFDQWQALHKAQQRQQINLLATHFLNAHRMLLTTTTTAQSQAQAQPQPALAAAIDRLIADLQLGLEAAIEEGLEAVAEAVRDCVVRLIEVGWKREGEVWAELRGVVEAWNVWTVRNRRSVAELVYLIRKDELERQEKEDERLARETAEREKDLAATQLAATTIADATAAAAVPSTTALTT